MKSQTEKLIIKELEPFFRNREYQWLAHYHQFRKQRKIGFDNVLINVNGSKPGLLDIKLGIRLDLVEQLAYQFTMGLSDYQEHSNTLVVKMGELIAQPHLRFEIKHEDDIKEAALRIIGFMQTKGFAFLEKYNDVNHLDQLFNEYPDQKLKYAYNAFNRCLKGIVLARLAERRNFQQLILTYRHYLLKRDTASQLIEKYDKLSRFLKNFSLN
ncbi:virulence-associated protein VapD [Catalinimonas alkaloidigena]|uniref:hypothetical protein n=1 Tax=Catalinimonas alkaloidigena TaxID=1075417 RepID=UPI002404D1EB|nr:hypothetical protein [Catalinimonas alkaloidigena]MDF9800618.1 virulence-associated protein VapD [Catalinimonas alkaloidigena]